MLSFKDAKDGYYEFADDAPPEWYAHLTPCERIAPPEKTPEQIAAEQKPILLAAITVITSNGNTFDGNETARNNMMAAIISADTVGQTETRWKLADNSFVTIGLAELKEALMLSIVEVGKIVGAIT